MAVSAQLRVVCRHFVANFKSLHVLSDLDNNPARLVSSHDWHCRIEVAIVDVKIGTADSARFYYGSVRSVKIRARFILGVPLMRTSCPFGCGTGIITSEKSLTLLYRIAFISVGMTNLAVVPLVAPFMAGIFQIWRFSRLGREDSRRGSSLIELGTDFIPDRELIYMPSRSDGPIFCRRNIYHPSISQCANPENLHSEEEYAPSRSTVLRTRWKSSHALL